jgi:hypothetical protein
VLPPTAVQVYRDKPPAATRTATCRRSIGSTTRTCRETKSCTSAGSVFRAGCAGLNPIEQHMHTPSGWRSRPRSTANVLPQRRHHVRRHRSRTRPRRTNVERMRASFARDHQGLATRTSRGSCSARSGRSSRSRTTRPSSSRPAATSARDRPPSSVCRRTRSAILDRATFSNIEHQGDRVGHRRSHPDTDPHRSRGGRGGLLDVGEHLKINFRGPAPGRHRVPLRRVRDRPPVGLAVRRRHPRARGPQPAARRHGDVYLEPLNMVPAGSQHRNPRSRSRCSPPGIDRDTIASLTGVRYAEEIPA